MRKPSDHGFRSATAACLALSWCLAGCQQADVPPPPRPSQYAGSTAPVAGFAAAGTPGAAQTAGLGAAGYIAPPPVTGEAGTFGPFSAAGVGAVATAGVGVPVPVGGAGTGEPVGPPPSGLPLFDAGADPARNSVAPGQLCARLAAINCAGEQHCCNSPGRTVDACKTDIANTCQAGLYLDTIAANPITGFDAAATAAAFTELEQRASACDPSVAAWGSSAEGLRGILKGTVAPGGSCSPPQAIPDAPTGAAALASCREISSHACFFMSALADWNCVAKGAVGSACNTDNNCVDGLFCNITRGAVGNCAARLAVGTACKDPNQCSSLYCKGGQCVAADQQSAYCLKN